MKSVNLYNMYADEIEEIAKRKSNDIEEWSVADVVDAIFDYVTDKAREEGKTFTEFVEEDLT